MSVSGLKASATISANSEKVWAFNVFTGPKDPELLAAYQMDQTLYYGWDIFGFFAKRLGWVLHGFYAIVGNFGLAIVLLTVLVRSLMFPVSRKMAVNSQRMQSLQPHTAKLREHSKKTLQDDDCPADAIQKGGNQSVCGVSASANSIAHHYRLVSLRVGRYQASPAAPNSGLGVVFELGRARHAL